VRGFLELVAIAALAPFVQGIVKTLRARLSGRPGPDVLQPYRDLRKLWSKSSILPDRTSPILLALPGLCVGVALTVAALVPSLDAAAIALTLALGRFFTVAAALDTRSSFEGMAASREMTFASLSELPLILAIVSGAVAPEHSLPRVLAAGAILLVLLFETARIPVDSQETHYELTMIHEGQLLEYGGWHLALLHYASYVRQLALLSVGALLLGAGAAAIGWIASFVVAGALIERGLAKLRLFEVPGVFASATILAVAGIGLQVVGTAWW